MKPRRISRAENMRVPPQRPKALIGVRHIQVLLIAVGLVCTYALRAIMSLAIVAMTSSNDAESNHQVYDWGSYEQSIILSSFFWIYVFTHIIGGQVATYIGAHKSLTIFVGGSAVMNAAVPLAARYGDWQGVCVCRVLVGTIQGGIIPASYALLSKWAPLEERGRFSMFIYAGAPLGTVVCMVTSGLLASSFAGWPGIFYFWAIATCIWAVVWWFLGSESPSDHTNIPLDEKEYIEISLGISETKPNEKLVIPWGKLITSKPMLAVILVNFGQTWGFWMFVSEIPTYMKNALGYDIESSGLLSSLPYLVSWILSFPVSYTSDMLIKNGVWSTTTSRKVCNTIGHWIPAVAIIGLAFVDKSQPILGVGVLVITVGVNSAVYCGFQANPMDLSPNFAGVLIGISNGIASVNGFLAPLIVGVIVKDSSNAEQWKIVFFITACIYFLGNLVFIIVGTSKLQSWNEPVKIVDAEVSSIPPIIEMRPLGEKGQID